jgi:hypothetical protein
MWSRPMRFQIGGHFDKVRKISKCSNFNENWYVGLSPHEECDSDKSDLKMATYLRSIL